VFRSLFPRDAPRSTLFVSGMKIRDQDLRSGMRGHMSLRRLAIAADESAVFMRYGPL
jgi:hypothetical protein